MPVERRTISRAEWRGKFSLKTGIFHKYPSQIYLFNYTEYYLEHWLNKQYLLFVVFRTLYNYHPCWSVTGRFVSQRKVRSPEGNLTFRGGQTGRVTLQQG